MSVCEACWKEATEIAANRQVSTHDVYAELVANRPTCPHQPTPPTRTGLHGLLDKSSRQIIDTGIFRPQTPERDASIEQAVSMRDELQAAVQEMRCETCRHWGANANPMISKYGNSCALRTGVWAKAEYCSAHELRTER